MSGIGNLRERVRLEQRGVNADGDRNGAWNAGDDALTVAAGFTYLRTGEGIQQARLEGKSPAVIRVWNSAAARAVTTAWRAVLPRTGQVFDLQSVEMTLDRKYIEFLALNLGSNE